MIRLFRKGLLAVLIAMGISSCSQNMSEVRQKESFNADWKFILADTETAKDSAFDDSSWRILNLPHDWAIEGDFSESNPSGTGGGALPGGIGWYRKTFSLNAEDADKKIFLDFDGVYMNSEVYLNGHLLGKRPYGYISFEYDITPYVNVNGQNVVAVKVDNSDQPNSRWYSGCGIYRNVWLVKTSKIHVAQWGTYVSTPQVSESESSIEMKTTVVNEQSQDVNAEVATLIISTDGVVRASQNSNLLIKANENAELAQQIQIVTPHLWNVDDPYVYKVRTEVKVDGKIVDTYTTPLGIRSFEFNAEKGFFVNGKHVKINGVCMHHDLGCLGAAINRRALQRQLEILKEMGCNGIRCSHNPPSPELLELCDEMGFIVMDESFDMWRKRKTERDYARFFDEWYERDLTDLVVRDRNHPSIFMWSIGNEVLEQWSDANADTLSLEQANMILNFGHDASQLASDSMSVNSLLTKRLASIVRNLDSTRPITAGCNEVNPNNHLFKSGALDIIGFNYHDAWVKDVPTNFPGMPFLYSESVSSLATRGYYRMPADSTVRCPDRWDRPYYDPTFACSSYDNCHVPWGSRHEETIDIVENNDYVAGQYIWTGFDYIGEPTPYGWPARSSYFGVIDLAGFPKDSYYLYQSVWSDKPMLHILPHWNWESGQLVDVWAYYNQADEVELFLNGKSLGTQSKAPHVYHVAWKVPFEAGTLKAVSRKDGKEVCTAEIKTAGEPAQIRLTADRNEIAADGYDLSFVTVEVVDKDGNLCPNADNLVTFDVEGEGFIAGVDNGSPISLERFKDNKRKAFYGKCLCVIQNNGKKGNIQLKASSQSLKECSINIVAK